MKKLLLTISTAASLLLVSTAFSDIEDGSKPVDCPEYTESREIFNCTHSGGVIVYQQYTVTCKKKYIAVGSESGTTTDHSSQCGTLEIPNSVPMECVGEETRISECSSSSAVPVQKPSE